MSKTPQNNTHRVNVTQTFLPTRIIRSSDIDQHITSSKNVNNGIYWQHCVDSNTEFVIKKIECLTLSRGLSKDFVEKLLLELNLKKTSVAQ